MDSGPSYQLPADDLEFTPLDQQHRKNTLALGGLYTCPELVKATLAPDKKSVLDLGCGSGVWAVEMALEYPNAFVLGLDMVSNSVKRFPPNCQFKIHDLNLGLSKYYNMFDVVRMRSVAGGLRSFADSVQEAVKCLRPGGVFLLVEGDCELYREDMITLQEPRNDRFRNGSWAAKHIYEIQEAMIKCGTDVLGAIASLDGGLWGYPGFDEDSLGAMSLFTPFGPWPESPNPHEQALLTRIGGIQRDVWKKFSDGSRIALVHTGMPGETIDQLVDRSVEDVDNPDRHRLWMRIRYCWGRKLLADGTAVQEVLPDKSGYAPLPPSDATPTPSRKNTGVVATAADGSDAPQIYHFKHYYYTKDAVRAWGDWKRRERRRIGLRALPSSIPWERVVPRD